jgi:hypothetical protein
MMVAVLLRFSDFHDVPISDCIAAMRVFESVEEAEAEAERLNSLPERRAFYFVKEAKWLR